MSQPAPRFWIGVVSRTHVLIGVQGGFAMLNHGKRPPLVRMGAGDWLIYYSPRTEINGAPLQTFTAIGTLTDRPAFQVEMQPGFTPWRREVDYVEATETPIASLKDRLGFTLGNWGMLARRGHFEISADDFATIHAAMT